MEPNTCEPEATTCDPANEPNSTPAAPAPAEAAPAPAAAPANDAQAGEAQGTPYQGMYDGGLANDRRVADYTNKAQEVNNECLDPVDRISALHDQANAEMNDAGEPGTELNPVAPNSGANAAFNGNNWTMKVDPDRYTDESVEDPADAASAAKTIYHESRHADQSYQIAQQQEGMGETPEVPGPVADQAAADPKLQCDDQSNQTQSWIHTGADADKVDAIEQGDDRHAYCQIPEEKDAWDTAAKVARAYPDGVDDRHLENCEHPAPATN